MAIDSALTPDAHRIPDAIFATAISMTLVARARPGVLTRRWTRPV